MNVAETATIRNKTKTKNLVSPLQAPIILITPYNPLNRSANWPAAWSLVHLRFEVWTGRAEGGGRPGRRAVANLLVQFFNIFGQQLASQLVSRTAHSFKIALGKSQKQQQ